MSSDVLDILDIFRTSYSFSNNISSTTGKMATVIYLVLFLYLSLNSIITVMSRSDKNVVMQQTYNNMFTTSSDYYKKLNIIFSVGVYRTDNALVTNPQDVLSEFLTIKISSINSQCLKYKIDDFVNSQIYTNLNTVTYFTS